MQTRTAALEQLVTERTAELQKGNQALTALYEVSRGLVTTLDLKSLLPIIAQQIGDTLGADCCTVFLFDEETEVLRARAAHGYLAERLGDFSYLPGEGVAGQTYATGVPQYVPDLNRAPDLPRRDEIRAVLAVPLMSPAAAPLGVLSVASLRPEAFTPHQQRLLETVAGQAAIAVQNARLYEAAEQQHRRQVALAEVELAINQAHELQTVLDRIAQVTTELLPASGGASVLLWDPQAEAFFASSSTVPGQVPETDAQSALYQGGATRWIVNHCQPLVVTDARDDHSGANPMLSEFGARAFAGVPLLAERAALGVLYALDQHPREYTQEDLDFLAALASRAAFAVTKVLLSESLQRVIEQARLDALANEVLLKEIHHRVKNNLQIVAGLLDLQSDYVRDEQSLQMLQESRSRARQWGLSTKNCIETGALKRLTLRITCRAWLRMCSACIEVTQRASPSRRMPKVLTWE